MKTMLLLLLTLSTCALALAQAPDTLWTRTYGGSASAGYAACQTSDGGFVLAGTYEDESSTGPEFYIVRINANGDTLWTRRLFEVDWATACFVHERSDGSIVAIAGRMMDYVPSIVFTKLTADGADAGMQSYIIQSQEQQGPFFSSAIATSDGGYFIVGTVEVPCMTMDIHVVRTDADGNELWSRTFGVGAHNDDSPAGAIELADHSLLLTGTSTDYSFPPYWSYIETWHFSATGDSLWAPAFGSTHCQYHEAILTSDTDFVMLGDSLGYYASALQFHTDGQAGWTRTYGSENERYAARWLHKLDAGDLVWAGNLGLVSDTSSHMSLMRCAPTGEQVWSQTYGCSRHDYCNTVVHTADNGYLLVGQTPVSGVDGGHAMYVVRTQTDASPVTIKKPLVLSFAVSAFPNPFNAVTLLSFTLPHEAKARVTVYDLLGREQMILADQPLSAGEHRIRFDGAALPSGLYFARLQAADYSTVCRLMLLK